MENIKVKRNHFYGKKHTKVTRKKMSDNHWSKKGISSWCKGLTKETDERLKMHSEKIKEQYKSGRIPYWKGKKDIPFTFKNKTFSEETRLKISGVNHYNWLGGISFEPYNKSFNNKFKRAIRRRDNQICMLCKIHREKLNKTLDVHHIDYDKLLSLPQNCVSLCKSCHMKTNHNRKQWKYFFQSLLNKLYDYHYEDGKIIIEVKA